MLAGSLDGRCITANTFECVDRLSGDSPTSNGPDSPGQNAFVDQFQYAAATQTKTGRHVRDAETVGEFSLQSVNRHARHQPHASATIPGRMHVAFQDTAVDQLGDGCGTQLKQTSRFRLTDPMSAREQSLVFGTLEETHLAVEMTQRVVPQKIGSQCVGRYRVSLLLKIVRLTKQQPEPPADPGGRGSVFGDTLEHIEKLLESLRPMTEYVGRGQPGNDVDREFLWESQGFLEILNPSRCLRGSGGQTFGPPDACRRRNVPIPTGWARRTDRREERQGGRALADSGGRCYVA